MNKSGGAKEPMMNESVENGEDGGEMLVDAGDNHDHGSNSKKYKPSRNLSEKKRRDKLNIYISELAAMVPSCASSQRKLDKTTVLKLTVAYMKVHNDLTMSVLGNESGLMSSFLSSEEIGELLDKALNGFLLVLSTSGDFVYVSKSIEDLSGLKKEELIGKSIFEIVHPDDKETMIREILRQDRGHSTGFNSHSEQLEPAGNDTSFQSKVENKPSRRTFNFRMLVRGKDGEPAGNEDVFCVGYIDQWMRKEAEHHKQRILATNENSLSTALTPIGSSVNPFFLVGVGIMASPSFMRVVECECDDSEFTSRHSLDGKFLFVDPRSISITGYMPFEVLGTSVYDYIHEDDLTVYAKAHEALMEYGEGKTGFYRILSKGYQWIWAATRSYISFNHWNSKPEIYCSNTTVISAAEGEKSLRVREKELEILKASQESHQSRFSQYKAPLKCNSPHEANALVLAKWAADELNLATLPSEQTDDGDNPGGDQNARGTNKNDGTQSGGVEDRRFGAESQASDSETDTRDGGDLDQDSFDLPSTVEELESFREAQRLLQNQLLEKHSLLLKAVARQKQQLQEIQQHMILNLQSQLFVDPVKLQETCSGYFERNKDLSERHEVQEQALESISRKLESQMQTAERRYQRHFKVLMEKKAEEQQMAAEQSIPQSSETFIDTAVSLGGQQQAQLENEDIVVEEMDPLNSRQRRELQREQTSSPLQLLPMDNQIDLQQQAHIEDVQSNAAMLKRRMTSPLNQRDQKVMRVDSNSKQMWLQSLPSSARPELQQPQAIVAASRPWQPSTAGQAVTNQGFVQSIPGVSNRGSVTVTTNVTSAPLPVPRQVGIQPNQSPHGQQSVQSQPSSHTPGAPVSAQAVLQHFSTSSQLNTPSHMNGGIVAMLGQSVGAFQGSSGETGVGFPAPQIATASANALQQQQSQQNSQMDASIVQSVEQLLTNSTQNQQIMQVLLTVLSALQGQPQVAASLITLLKQIQDGQQQGQGEVPSAVQPAAPQFPVGLGTQGQTTSQLCTTAPPPPLYSYNNEVTYQQQQPTPPSMLPNQRRIPQQPPRSRPTVPLQHPRQDATGLGITRVSSTTTSYSIALQQQQQQQQQQLQQQRQQQQQHQQQQQRQQQQQQQQQQRQIGRNSSMNNLGPSQISSSANTSSMNFMPYENMASTSTGVTSVTAIRDFDLLEKKKTSKSKGDYFSNFSSDELRAMLMDAPGAMSNNESATNMAVDKQEKKLEDEELLYNPLLTQQQQLLQLHQEQRRQLLLQQQEQQLLMFEEQKRREEAGQQQGATSPTTSNFSSSGLRAMLSDDPQEGSSRQIGDQNVQDGGPSFSGWSETNYSLGEADEQVLGLLLAESAFDPLLDNIDWGDDSYTGEINLNPD